MNKHTIQNTDELELNIGVNNEDRKKVAIALSSLLASNYILYMKTLFYHWNVVGTNFNSLHKMFETQYEELHVSGDKIAERIRALGHFTPGSFKEYISISTLKEDDRLPKDSLTMLQNLLKDHEACSLEARKVLKIAEKANDEVTADMMIGRMTEHEETAWMLRSSCEKE